MLNLVMGANAPLTAMRFEVLIEWPTAAGLLDSSTYLLRGSGRVRSDDDMIFYNQPEDPDGCVRISGSKSGQTRLSVDLDRAPEDIERIVMCVTVDDPDHTMASFQGVTVTVIADGAPIMQFKPDLDGAREVAMRLTAIYRRNGSWKIRADGQGYHGGLAPLARSFGIDVEEDERTDSHHAGQVNASDAHGTAEPDDQLVAPPQTAQPSQSPERSDPSVRDDGTSRLTDEHGSIRWEGELGEIIAELTWDSQSGGLLGRPRPLQPELGCFYRLADGRRGVVQLWDGSGQYDTAPFAYLSQAERNGAQGRQRLRVNGARRSALTELTLFAHLQSDAPNWNGAELLLTLSTADRKPIALNVEGGPDGCAIVALVKLASLDGQLQISRLLRYAPGHQELDEQLGWQLRWRTRHH